MSFRKTTSLLVCLVGMGASTTSCQRILPFRTADDSAKSDFALGPSRSSALAEAESTEGSMQPKKRVYVFDFWNDTPVNQNDYGTFTADELRRGLALSQRVILPTDVKTERTTGDFVRGDQIKVGQLIREGQTLGVAVVVIGRITKIKIRQKGEDFGLLRQKQFLASVDLDAKIFDVHGGREITATTRSGDSLTRTFTAFETEQADPASQRNEVAQMAIREAVANLIPDVIKTVDKITWQGRIAKITGSKIYINSGLSSGLMTGDILKVLTPGEDIYDPVSGAYVGRSQGQLKGTVEVVNLMGADGAMARVHTGGNFHDGDFVQLY